MVTAEIITANGNVYNITECVDIKVNPCETVGEQSEPDMVDKDKSYYGWHDLRKDPTDLPEFLIFNQLHCYSDAVIVVDKSGVYDTAIYIRNVVNGNCNVGDCHFIFNAYDDEFDLYGWGGMKDEDVVAWKYIQPFDYGDKEGEKQND